MLRNVFDDHKRRVSGITTDKSALEVIKSQLGRSFFQSEPDWMSQVQHLCDELGTTRPKRHGESEQEWHQRLEREVLEANPQLAAEICDRRRLAGFILGHRENRLVRDDILPKLDCACFGRSRYSVHRRRDGSV